MEVYESLFGGEPKPEVKKTILSVVKNQETQGLFLSVPGSSSSDLPSQPLGLGIVDMLSTKLLVKDSALLKPAAIIESPGLVGTVNPPATLFKPPGLVSTTPPLKKTPPPAFRARHSYRFAAVNVYKAAKSVIAAHSFWWGCP